ncbi:MAG: hypothetical protein HON65_15795 [Rhodospirillales bacterium]|jgi:hypothetical protein|nr:hypothetical protein [Rhodospirillales bacterium]
MKRNTLEVITVGSELKNPCEDICDTALAGKLPPEMENRADARELREFMQIFLSIEDISVRQRILEEVRLASQEVD